MIDIQILREHPEILEHAVAKRGIALDIRAIAQRDAEYVTLLQQVEELRREQKQSSHGPLDAAKRPALLALKKKLKAAETKLEKLATERLIALQSIPNIPADDVPAGGKESNTILTTGGKKPSFGFTPKDHVDLVTTLKMVDYERGAKMSGSGFWIYTGAGAQLEWALLNYFIQFHQKNGYTFILPPYLLTEASAVTSGHLPKFREDLYWTEESLCLNATSEMMLGNLHRDEILDAQQLPLKYYAYSTCFRREAGAYRTQERGMIRGHQFNKVEMFQLTQPGQSDAAFDELVHNAESLVKNLGLHYQLSLLAAGDASAAMAKTVDVEVWIPSMDAFKEVSSVSNARDYQARRGTIKYKDPATGKKEFVHTLNASGLATSRLVPAIVEQFQMKDGSVAVPKALHKFLPFKKITLQ